MKYIFQENIKQTKVGYLWVIHIKAEFKAEKTYLGKERVIA